MINKKTIIILLALFILIFPTSAQKKIAISEFKPACDSIAAAIKKRDAIRWVLKLKSVTQRDTILDFYFTESLGDYPWYQDNAAWFRDTLKQALPPKYQSLTIGEIYSNNVHLDSLITPDLGFDGNPIKVTHTTRKPTGKYVVRRAERLNFTKGLDGRHIAIWQSHGRYFDVNTEQWRWQRPCLFQICEDLFTQSYVLKYLTPMLENAGAYVMLPRERDTQIHECIVDNDSTYTGPGGRYIGTYSETGIWTSSGAGFADKKVTYLTLENPFMMGTAKQTACVADSTSNSYAKIVWRAQIPERGEYAVYVSYKTIKESTTAARYTVHHLGGDTEFIVNQKLGGSTWIYLGTFEFEKGETGYVTLDNTTPKGHKFSNGKFVTADAVKFGGGMGNIARGRKFDPQVDTIPVYDPCVSELPRSAEGARYWLQWAGAPESVYSRNDGTHDYKDDYMCRPEWVSWMSGGSVVNPKQAGKGIPFDISLAFHTDAGITDGQSCIGTLSIYTLKSRGSQTNPSGGDRMTNRHLADAIQSQIVHDLRHLQDSIWSRRWIWDRSYYESRVPPCPAILLELLSHQNFRDMRYGLDPQFQFDASRAVYKGILKYLSNRYEQPYVVQPLPVKNLSVRFLRDSSAIQNKAILSWNKVLDPIEPTANPEGYILYTKVDNGGYDDGKVITDITKNGDIISSSIDIEPGHVYSFKVAAYNTGGKSFAIENVSIGLPAQMDSTRLTKVVMVVNNFDRVSGPAFYDNAEYGGFVNRQESGIAYMKDISFVGETYIYSKKVEYVSDADPGFGASFYDQAAKVIAGNTFEYTHNHGKSLLELGYAFQSCNKEVFCSDATIRNGIWCVDLICGRQVTTVMPDGSEKFKVFPQDLQSAIRDYTSKGGNLIVSGAYIATDIWNKLYPVSQDKAFIKSSIDFAQKVLGYKSNGNYGSRSGEIKMTAGGPLKWTPDNSEIQIYNTPNRNFYCVENPDAITTASKYARVIARYSDSGAPAGVAYQGDGYKSVSYGFPLETLQNPDHLKSIMGASLMYLEK